MNIQAEKQGLCVNLIIDGKIIHEHLKLIGLQEDVLRKELAKMSYLDPSDILLATMDHKREIHIYGKNSENDFNVLD